MNTLVQLNTPSRLIPSTFRHEAWSILTKVLSELMPALLTRMSRRPNSFRTSWAIRNVSGKSPTSACASIARRPILRICSATSFAAASLET